MRFLFALLSLFLAFSRPISAWHSCQGGGICPNGNTCCSTTPEGGSTCISSKNATLGSCCTDNAEGSTGCGDGFECAFDESQKDYYCQKVDASDDSLPDRLPRYRLCSLPGKVFKEVYGLPVNWKKETPRLAYLSTMGPIDASDPMTLSQHAKVTTLVVMVHGSGRNPDDYICCTNSALPDGEQNPYHSSMMVVAPWFLAPDDGKVNLTSSDEATPLVWAEFGPIYHTWRYGADAINANISSYATMDGLVDRILEDDVRFPALKRIILAGHSAGGQFTQRWALLTNSLAFKSHSRASIRVIVANPKSFCFLDERRYVNGTLQVPDEGAIDDCPWYNEWEWGLGEGSFLDTPYKVSAIEEAGGKDVVVQRYAARDIVYLAGEQDILPNGMCMATMQGAYRRIRSKHFHDSLREIYGRPVHRRLVVSGVNHNHCLMYQSPEGNQAMFA